MFDFKNCYKNRVLIDFLHLHLYADNYIFHGSFTQFKSEGLICLAYLISSKVL